MLKVGGGVAKDGYIELSLKRPHEFATPPGSEVGDIAPRTVSRTFVQIGDAVAGPVIKFFSTAPGVDLPSFAAHSHASDSWRLVMRGEFAMGKDVYVSGDFRLQQGWRPYPGDRVACGPDGGWTMLMFADRRGTRMRAVKTEHQEVFMATQTQPMADWEGTAGDLFSDAPNDTAGPTALVTTLGEPGKPGHVDGTFKHTSGWRSVGANVRMAAALLGDADCGPALLMTATAPGEVSAPQCAVSTELLRLIVDGSCTIGNEHYAAGDIRVQAAGAATSTVVAGPEGVSEVLVFGDRRGASPSASGEGWSAAIDQVLEELSAKLDQRVPGSSRARKSS